MIPAIAQDIDSGNVLMLAFMNEEALALTRSTGLAHYWSRGRGMLWRKGETSGNDQVVHQILVNCELNSLLLKVRQSGAVCHTGFPTCYFRSLDEDGSLTVVRERAFDPETVYGQSGAPNHLEESTRLQFDAYVFLRDNDLERESGTSRRLRQSDEHWRARVSDELIELAGVLDGEHRHEDLVSDVCLEASQVIYWVLLEAIRSGATWERLRPDRALKTADETVAAATVSKLLRGEAHRWRQSAPDVHDLDSTAHATLALVGQACRAAGIDPLEPVHKDLDELRSRSYLSAYFSRSAGKSGSILGMTGSSEEPGRTSSSSTRPSDLAKTDRLWTPWRMRYVAGGAREDGCIFCNRLSGDDDVDSLILHRGEHAFVIMNLFPYNTGHVMIVPNAHVGSPEDADDETLAEMTSQRVQVLRAIRRGLSPEGFNLGLNVGAVAGAGIDDHVHEHVVPRWQGDANFMPIVASTMVMPELIPVTYAKLRAELSREIHESNQVVSVIVSHDRQKILLDAHQRLPRTSADVNEASWRAGERAAQVAGANDVELVGWAGSNRADAGPIAFVFRAALPNQNAATRTKVTALFSTERAPSDNQFLHAAFNRLRMMS